MSPTSVVSGPGYSVDLPEGFSVFGSPLPGTYWLLPPGSMLGPSPPHAIVAIGPAQPMALPALLQELYNFENPLVASVAAAGMGFAQVIGMQPARQAELPQGTAHIREFDAINIRGFMGRAMCMVIQGPKSAVAVTWFLDLFRWVEFIAPCLNFVGRIRLEGSQATTPLLRAVIDKNHTDQIEYQFVDQHKNTIPLTSMPTTVGGTTIINAREVIITGNINGTGVAIGDHTTARVS